MPLVRVHFEAATQAELEHVSPVAGDISICIDCGGLNFFNSKLHLRKATAKDVIEIKEKDPAAWKLIEDTRERLAIIRALQRK